MDKIMVTLMFIWATIIYYILRCEILKNRKKIEDIEYSIEREYYEALEKSKGADHV